MTKQNNKLLLDQIIEDGIKLVQWVLDNKDWLLPMVVAIGGVTTAWNLATIAVNGFKTAAGIAAIAGTAGTAAAIGVPLVGAAAIGGYGKGEALMSLEQKMEQGRANDEYNRSRGLPLGTPVPQNITINMNAGNITGQQIADAIRRANRSTGTNVLQTPQ
jgi:hypothetical protein